MRKKKILIGLVMAMMIAGTTGCGNHKSDRNSSEAVYLGSSASNKSASYAAAATEASADWECGLSDGEFEYSPESAYNGVSSEARSVETDDTTNTLSQIDTEKLVYRCDMQFDTEDYNSSINELKNLMNKYGAFLEYENEWNNGGSKNTPSLHNYNATIRIPVENYQAFLDGIGNLGDLKNKSQNVENLSQEYSDLSAELEVLEAKRDSYISMMKEAKTLDDMESLLMIDERLTEVEVSINRIKTRINNINNDVSFSYITITINEVREYEAPAAETFGQRVSQAFKDGWKNFKEGCQDFVIWAAEHVIGLGIFFVILLIIWFALLRKPFKAFRKWLRNKKAAKKAAKAANNTSTAYNTSTGKVDISAVPSDNTGVPVDSSVSDSADVPADSSVSDSANVPADSSISGSADAPSDTAADNTEV